MAKSDPCFPKQIILNGADYFLLQLDQIMLQSSGRRNVCTFVLELEDQLDHLAFEQSLLNNSAYRWICSLRIKKSPPFLLTQWVTDINAEIPTVAFHRLPDAQPIPGNLLASEISPESHSPFKVDLLQMPDKGAIVIFTWHHSLMDAHGGESFIRFLGGAYSAKKMGWVQENQPHMPLGQRAQIAHNMKDFLHHVSRLPLLSLFNKKTINPTLHYKVMSFTVEQSQLIGERAGYHGAGFLLSSFYLAATACSVAHIKQKNGSVDADVLVPIPLDRRKRGADAPIIGNQVSFLFYRIPQKTLSDLKVCTTELMQQMKQLMLSEKPDQGVIMMDFMRRMPGFLYRILIKQPTAGLMASFFFSDTGDTLANLKQLFNKNIKSAMHYPPTMYPPGMTFVYGYFQGKLNITFGYMQEVIDDAEVEQLLQHLRNELLGKSNRL